MKEGDDMNKKKITIILPLKLADDIKTLQCAAKDDSLTETIQKILEEYVTNNRDTINQFNELYDKINKPQKKSLTTKVSQTTSGNDINEEQLLLDIQEEK